MQKDATLIITLKKEKYKMEEITEKEYKKVTTATKLFIRKLVRKLDRAKKESSKLWAIVFMQMAVIVVLTLMVLSAPLAYKKMLRELNGIKGQLNTIQLDISRMSHSDYQDWDVEFTFEGNSELKEK